MRDDALPMVVILAGGLATRLRPVTERIPKSLVDVNGEPFIAHQLRLLRRNGAHRIVVCAGYLGEQIQSAVGDGSSYGVSVLYSFDGPVPLGTGGALRAASSLLGESFLVVYGDSYLDCDYRGAWKAFADAGTAGLMSIYRNDGQWDSSNVEFDGRRIVAYDKTERSPRMRYIDYGLGIFRHAALERVPESSPFDLATLYQMLLRDGQLAAWIADRRFYEVGSFAGLEETRAYIAGAQLRTQTS